MNHTEKQALIDELLGALNSKNNRVRVVQAECPLGMRVQANSPAGCATTIIVSPNNSGRFLIRGVRSFNKPGEIEILRLATGDGLHRNATSFDSASYSLDHGAFKDTDPGEHLAYYRAPWGEINNQDPMTISFAALGSHAVLPFISWTLYGTFVREIEVGDVSLEVTKLGEGEQPSDVPEPAESSSWPRQ